MSILSRVTESLFGGAGQTLASAADQSQEEKNLVSFVREKIDECRQTGSRIAHEGVWMTNIAYLMGIDGVVYDPATRNFRPVNRAGRAPLASRLRVNKILPRAQNRQARLCKSPPKWDIRPESTDQEDKDAARLGIQVLQCILDREEFPLKRLEAVGWSQQCGYSFLHALWDDAKGEPVVDPISGEFAGVYQGDVAIEVLSSFEVFTDPLAKNMRDCQWAVKTKVRKLDYFRDRYPERGNLVKEEDAWLLSTQYELKINSLSQPNSSGSDTQKLMKNSAIECVYYERPSRKHPKGRTVTTANGILLEDKELAIGEIPLVKLDDTTVSGKFASETPITHARPIQDQTNLLIRRRSDWTRKLLAGKYLAVKGSGLSAEALDDTNGEIVEYNNVPGAPPPTPMAIPNIPQYAYEEENRHDSQMNDVFGLGEISQGKLPAAGIPAIGMQFIQEQDDTRLGIVTAQHEIAFAKLGQMILKFVGRYYKTERMIKVAGEGLDYAVKKVTGEMLRNNYDVLVIPGSTVPGSKVLRRQEILNAYDRGLLGQPDDPKLTEKIRSILEFGDLAEVWQDHAVDMAQVKATIVEIENGQEPEVNELDNHALHIQEKNRYRKTDKFKKLSPEAQFLMLQDINRHIEALASIQNPGLDEQKELAQEAVAVGQETPAEEGMAPIEQEPEAMEGQIA